MSDDFSRLQYACDETGKPWSFSRLLGHIKHEGHVFKKIPGFSTYYASGTTEAIIYFNKNNELRRMAACNVNRKPTFHPGVRLNSDSGENLMRSVPRLIWETYNGPLPPSVYVTRIDPSKGFILGNLKRMRKAEKG